MVHSMQAERPGNITRALPLNPTRIGSLTDLVYMHTYANIQYTAHIYRMQNHLPDALTDGKAEQRSGI